MQINVSGHHIDVTTALSKFVKSKFAKLEQRHPQLGAISVILTVDRNEQKVEVNTQYQGARICVHASNDDLYAAITSSSKKIGSALSHRKGALDAKIHSKKQAIEE